MNNKLYHYIPLNKYYWIYFLTVGISVFIYGKYRCVNKDYTDILALELYPKIDGWLISHFVAFAIAGVFTSLAQEISFEKENLFKKFIFMINLFLSKLVIKFASR